MSKVCPAENLWSPEQLPLVFSPFFNRPTAHLLAFSRHISRAQRHILHPTLAHLLWSQAPPPPLGPGRDDGSDSRGPDGINGRTGHPSIGSSGTMAAAAVPSQPMRTPQLCFATVVLRDFLRASRAVDDTITQHLNALVAPSRAGFDPSSTARRALSVSAASSAPPSPSCRAFCDTILFPSWQARDDVIRYCTDVAREAQESAATAAAADSVAAASAATLASAAAAAQAVESPTASAAVAAAGTATPPPPPAHLSERFDPYVNRRQYAQVESQAELLAAQMRQERSVETIVRAQSWAVLRARCGGSVVDDGSEAGSWEDALAQWSKTRR